MSRPQRTLRIAVGTALLALGACQKDKPTTQTPEPDATEHSNVGPEGEPVPEHTNVGPEEEPATKEPAAATPEG